MPETYEQYLNRWQERFGETVVVECGCYTGYFDYGQHKDVIVYRLTREEWQAHMVALDEARSRLTAAVATGKKIDIQRALADSVWHEITLLL